MAIAQPLRTRAAALAADRFLLALAATGLAALALRLWRLDALGGFDWDEVATVYIAARPLPDLLSYLRGAPFEHPPVYYVLAHWWLSAFGREEPALRILSALFGALTVPVVGALGARLFSRQVGLVAAGVLAIAPAHLFYSRDARMYPLLTLLVALALYALARVTTTTAQGRPDRGHAAGWWALWAGASLLAVATHYYAVFALAGQVLYLLCTRRMGRAGALALGGTLLVASGALAAWWALSPGLRHSLSGLRLAPLRAEEAALSLWRAVAGVLRGPYGDEPPVLDEMGGALAILLLVAASVAAWRRYPAGARLLVTAGLAPLLGLVALMLVGRDLNARFLLMLLPVAALALAAGASALAAARWPVPTLALIGAVAAGPWLLAYYGQYVRGDYAVALRWVESNEQPGEAVVFNGPWQTLLFDHYYRGRLPAHILTGEVPLVEAQVAAALGEVVGRYRGIWLLETDMGNADPTEFVPRWLARYAYRRTVINYRQVRVGHYLLASEPLPLRPLAVSLGDVDLVHLAVEADGPRPGATTLIELGWRVGPDLDPGLKASIRLRDAQGGVWWGTDRWLAEGWLAPRPARPGDLLYTRVAAKLPATAPASPYTVQVVAYGSTRSPESGEGWIAWSSEPLDLPLTPPQASAPAATSAAR